VSLEGTALIERKDTNAAFYGQRIPAADLLNGKVPAPEAGSALYTVIEAAEQMDETALPSSSFIVSSHVKLNCKHCSLQLQPEAAPLMSPSSPGRHERPIFDADNPEGSTEGISEKY